MLVDSESSKHFVDPKLIPSVESRMQDYTEINPPMEVKAASHTTLFGTVQGILLVVVRDVQDVCRTVKLPIVARFRAKSIFNSVGSSERCQNYFH